MISAKVVAPTPSYLAPCCFFHDAAGASGVLSNYALTPFFIDQLKWNSVEHYYQAAKFEHADDIASIRDVYSAADAKAIAWGKLNDRVRSDWDEMRVGVMKRALKAKFSQFATAREALLSTWPAPLLEDSIEDGFWGRGVNGTGCNKMGMLLEELREELFGLPNCFEVILEHLPPPEAGRSEIRWGAVRPIVCPTVVRREIPPLVFEDFATVGIVELMVKGIQAHGLEQHINIELLRKNQSMSASVQWGNDAKVLDQIYELRGRAFDEKYSSYSWYQDARSCVVGWTDQFLGILFRLSRQNFVEGRILVVGAGSGNEAAQLWRSFGSRATLCEIGDQLVQNCRSEAPEAMVHHLNAEQLSMVGDQTYEVYCSLRAFESLFLDVSLALKEAKRVLKPGGLLAISVSNGYLTLEGTIAHGQIQGEGFIDLLAPWFKLIDIGRTAERLGFVRPSFFNLGSEIGFSAFAPG